MTRAEKKIKLYADKKADQTLTAQNISLGSILASAFSKKLSFSWRNVNEFDRMCGIRYVDLTEEETALVKTLSEFDFPEPKLFSVGLDGYSVEIIITGEKEKKVRFWMEPPDEWKKEIEPVLKLCKALYSETLPSLEEKEDYWRKEF